MKVIVLFAFVVTALAASVPRSNFVPLPALSPDYPCDWIEKSVDIGLRKADAATSEESLDMLQELSDIILGSLESIINDGEIRKTFEDGTDFFIGLILDILEWLPELLQQLTTRSKGKTAGAYDSKENPITFAVEVMIKMAALEKLMQLDCGIPGIMPIYCDGETKKLKAELQSDLNNFKQAIGPFMNQLGQASGLTQKKVEDAIVAVNKAIDNASAM